jgi:threonine/homoserine/homoserine lactone efflux protein
MLKFLPYILRNTLRNRARTLLTIFGMMVAALVFCFLASIESSMNSAIDKVAQTTLLVLGEKDQW